MTCQHPGCTAAAICEPDLDDTPTWCPEHCELCGGDSTRGAA